MDDLISRKAALYMLEWKSTVKGAVDAIKNMPSAQQWIPCSERLPDGEQHLLVSVHDNSNFVTLDVWAGKGFWTYGHRVTAWMPLPEPYREEISD